MNYFPRHRRDESFPCVLTLFSLQSGHHYFRTIEPSCWQLVIQSPIVKNQTENARIHTHTHKLIEKENSQKLNITKYNKFKIIFLLTSIS